MILELIQIATKLLDLELKELPLKKLCSKKAVQQFAVKIPIYSEYFPILNFPML